jgi:hypothetical protein
MSVAELDSIEWRGLVVRSVNVRGNGLSLELDSVPNELGGFSTAVLDLSGAESMDLQVNGLLSLSDLDELHIHWLAYIPSGSDQISGSLGLMPGRAGFWQVDFNNASWQLRCYPPICGQPI